MFEFYGSLSDDIIKKSSTKQNKTLAISFFIISFIALCLTIVFIFVDKSFLLEMIIITIILFMIAIALLFCTPKSIIYKLPKKITFCLEKDIVSEEIPQLNNKQNIRKISNIKTIYDYGDCYFIIFKYKISDYIVCQKNLLITGNIEDFEKYFQNLIKIHR